LEPIEDLEASDYSEIDTSESVDGDDDGPFKRNKKKRDSTALNKPAANAPKLADTGRIIVNGMYDQLLC